VIINVRGANGSGKTTAVRSVLNEYQTRKPHFVEGRSKPLYYTCESPGLLPVKILGSYELVSGGCDNIPEVETVFTLARMLADGGANVIFEGILAQHSSTRLLDLHRVHPVDVLVLTTSQDDCVASVKDRRRERGADVDNFDPKNVIKEWKSVQSSSKTLQTKGMHVMRLSRAEIVPYILEKLTLSNQPPADTNLNSGVGIDRDGEYMTDGKKW